jgi:hypothetical protein
MTISLASRLAVPLALLFSSAGPQAQTKVAALEDIKSQADLDKAIT